MTTSDGFQLVNILVYHNKDYPLDMLAALPQVKIDSVVEIIDDGDKQRPLEPAKDYEVVQRGKRAFLRLFGDADARLSIAFRVGGEERSRSAHWLAVLLPAVAAIVGASVPPAIGCIGARSSERLKEYDRFADELDCPPGRTGPGCVLAAFDSARTSLAQSRDESSEWRENAFACSERMDQLSDYAGRMRLLSACGGGAEDCFLVAWKYTRKYLGSACSKSQDSQALKKCREVEAGQLDAPAGSASPIPTSVASQSTPLKRSP